jgi:upstream activation factor subunit UAF30
MAEVTLENVFTLLTDLTKKVESLSKIVRKVRATQEDPTGEKAKARAANNGFNRPQQITDELRKFLDLEAEATISRGEVTRRITQYVNDNNLKHPDNGRHIVLDDKLRALLNPPADVQLSYMNLQKYLSGHYVKQPKEPKAPKEPKEPKEMAKKRPTVKKTVKA